MARPRLVLGARGQVGDHHLHCLQLLVLGRDGAHLVGDLVACHGNVLAFNAVGGKLGLAVDHINARSLLQLTDIFIIIVILGAQSTSGILQSLPPIKV